MSEIVCFYTTKKVGQWLIKVHKPHGSKSFDQPHVHLTRRGVKGQYSWNVDGTRHDRHRFPISATQIKRAKELASNELGVPVGSLQLLVGLPGGSRISVSMVGKSKKQQRLLLSTYVRLSEDLLFFGTNNGFAVVISDDEQLIVSPESEEE